MVGCQPDAPPFWLAAAAIVLTFSFFGFLVSRLPFCSPLAMSLSCWWMVNRFTAFGLVPYHDGSGYIVSSATWFHNGPRARSLRRFRQPIHSRRSHEGLASPIGLLRSNPSLPNELLQRRRRRKREALVVLKDSFVERDPQEGFNACGSLLSWVSNVAAQF